MHARRLVRSVSAWGPLAILVLLCTAQRAAAADVAVVDPHAPRVVLTDALSVYVDPTGKLDVEDVAQPAFADHFVAPTGDPRNLGHIHSVLWIRFALRFAPGDRAPRVLELAYPFVDSLTLYAPRPGGGFEASRAGDHTRVSERALPDRGFLFPIAPTPGGAATYYLRYQSVGLVSLPLSLWRDDALRAARQTEALALGIYYGCLITLLLYNLALYVALRARVYLAYVVYTATMVFFMGTQNGLASLYLYPELPQIVDRASYLAVVLAATGVTYFVHTYLASGALSPRAGRVLRTLQWLGLAILVAIPVAPRLVAFWCSMLFGLGAVLVVYSVALYHWIGARSRPAAYVAVAITLPAAGASLLFLRNIGLFPVTWITEYGMQIGTMFEMLVLSLGLAEQVAVIRREREEARRAASEDALTGLANRTHLAAALPQILSRARRNGRRFGVLWIDIDDLKPINDRYGHAAGDALLRHTAARMREAVRAHDLVARVGGDEFVVVAEADHDGGNLAALAARLNASIAAPIEYGALRLQTSASIGIAIYPLHADNVSDLLARADRAMYEAKAAGGSTYRLAA